jgi:hypothetical protein
LVSGSDYTNEGSFEGAKRKFIESDVANIVQEMGKIQGEIDWWW